ncbi:MAG TPA: hypothetical protein VGM37_04000 [Armatimonadota bacterium]
MTNPNAERERIYQEPGLYLYTEERARLADDGSMLPADEAPDDGLCRVIVDQRLPFDSPPAPEDQAAWMRRPFGYPTIVAMAVAALAGRQSRLWYLGEACLPDIGLVEEALGRSVARLADTRHSRSVSPSTGRIVPCHSVDVIAFRIGGGDIGPQTTLPLFANTVSPRVFAFDRPDTEMEGELVEIERAFIQGDDAALGHWDAINRMGFRRDGVLRFCQDAIVTVIPGGPHGDHAEIYSTRLDLRAIAAALRAVGESAGLACIEIPNLGDEYAKLHA